MRSLRLVALALFPSLFFAPGCVAESDDIGQSEESHTATVSFSVLEGPRKSNAAAGLTVIKSKSAYKSFFGEKAPEGVDFNKHWVLHVSLGIRNTGGYSVEVERIDKLHSGSSHKLQVHAVEHRPGNDCFVTMALTNPQVTVRINKQPNVKGAAELEQELDVYSCSLDESCADLGGEEKIEDVFVNVGDTMSCVEEVSHCITNDHGSCPQLSPLPPDFCSDGEVVMGAPHYISSADGMECEMPSVHCVTKDHGACPQFSPLPPNYCEGGEVRQGAPNFIPSADGMECWIPSVHCVQPDVCG